MWLNQKKSSLGLFLGILLPTLTQRGFEPLSHQSVTHLVFTCLAYTSSNPVKILYMHALEVPL